MVTTDMLVRNTGQHAISRLRVLFPNSLVDIRTIKRYKNETKASAAVNRCREEQLQRVRLLTHQFSSHTDPSHWAYHNDAGHHLEIRSNLCVPGRFAIARYGQSHGDIDLGGYIKQDWKISAPAGPDSISDWLWLLYAANRLTLFDLIAPGNPQEHLKFDESMWIRLEFSVPPAIYNRHSIWQRIFARSLEYQQVFISPEAIIERAKGQLRDFKVEDKHRSDNVKLLIQGALANAHTRLPATATPSHIHDWRILCYREYGLAIDNIQHRGITPCIPPLPSNYLLPPTAYPREARRAPAPQFLQWLFRESVREACTEFWFGTDHNLSAGSGKLITQIQLRATVLTYTYLAWLGVVALFLSVVNTIANWGNIAAAWHHIFANLLRLLR
ncbi:MAG: hypothetical protein ABSF29_05960 [Tepidisphaeraceae bacterium]